MLCERGGVPDVAKVLDFGLVKEAEDEARLTHDGAIVGTPMFLAPEALQAAQAGPAADVYAVGAVAYYLLCGRHVFEGKSVVEAPPSPSGGIPLR